MRAEVVCTAGFMVMTLVIGQKTHISQGWYYHFLKRWPELHAIKPSSLSELRAKAASQECVSNYFTELETILTKYNLKDKPGFIFNVDEKGNHTEGGKPPSNVTSKDKKKSASNYFQKSTNCYCSGLWKCIWDLYSTIFCFPRKKNVTWVIGRGNTRVWWDCKTDWQWYIIQILNFLLTMPRTIFLDLFLTRDVNQPISLLYDGHKSHISVSLIQWAHKNNIILFVLPPHCSHILQPMNVGCFSPFENLYQQEAWFI